MRLLLDTHTVIWATGTTELLSPTARFALADPDNDLVVSAISAYETVSKHRLGKLPHVGALVAGWDDALRRIGATTLPLSGHHALTAGRIDWQHRDPFDRLLAAQAICEDLVLVTCDRVFITEPPARLTTLW